jgi:hypothetical protein
VDKNRTSVPEVVTNYVWAYAFDSGVVTIVHDEQDWDFYRAGDVRPSDVSRAMINLHPAPELSMYPNTTPADKPSFPTRAGRFLRKVLILILRRFAIAIVAIGLIVFALTHFTTHNDANTDATPPDPFQGTPAANWANGADSIPVPTATAVTGFTQAEVATDLAMVKQALDEARLDPQMVIQGSPDTFLGLIAPAERDKLNSDLNGKLAWGTVIDETARLDNSHPPRYSGTMTFSSIVDDNGIRAVQVATNFVWAYAFSEGDVSIVHDEDHWLFYRSGSVKPDEVGMWLEDYQSYASNIDCSAIARGRLAPPLTFIGGDPNGTGQSQGDDNSLYDPNHSMDINSTC